MSKDKSHIIKMQRYKCVCVKNTFRINMYIDIHGTEVQRYRYKCKKLKVNDGKVVRGFSGGLLLKKLFYIKLD